MDLPKPPGEEILFISDEPVPDTHAARRWRIARRVVGAALVVPIVLVTAHGVLDAVQRSRLEQCSVRLKRVGLALAEYQEKNRHFPAPAIARADGAPLLSWRVEILPYLGYQSLYDHFHRDEPWDSAHNRALIAEMPKEFACPGGPGQRSGQTGYLVIVGPKTEFGSVNTPFEPTRGAEIREFIDGTSNTVLVLETDELVPWTKPDDLRWSPDGPLPKLASPHKGGAHVLFADGSRPFLKPTIGPNILLGLLTINGNEVLSSS